jgi:hypothetical protein
VAFSVAFMSLGLGAFAWYVFRLTHSAAAALLLPFVILANPDVLYLQSTPMTEPLLFGLSFASLLAVDIWIESGGTRAAHRAGLIMAALVLTRYEGWFIAGALGVLAWTARPAPRKGWAWLAAWPIGAAIAFFALSYISSGILLATSGFFTPNNRAYGAWDIAVIEVLHAAAIIAGPVVITAGALGVLAALARVPHTRGRSLLCLGLLAAGILPASAFHAGHPERVRYMVALAVGATAAATAALAALPARARGAAAGLMLALTLVARPPLSSDSPMVVEAQWEVPYSNARQAVTQYLSEHYDGTPILASMGDLAHYMQQTMVIGLPLKAFLHEGNGDLWTDAVQAPRDYVKWILIEEIARGGGQLALRAREDPSFLSGFVRVSEGGGLALYHRQ